MNDRRVIAVLGGSSAFLPRLAAGLAERRDDLPSLELRLLGRDEARTHAVARFCDAVASRRAADHRYAPTTDVRRAVDAAAVVLNQVRVGGFAERVFDETFPHAFEEPGDETIGPGGLSAALRSVPVVRGLATAAREVSDGWFVNLSNPLGILVRAIEPVLGDRGFGLCELPSDTLSCALALLGTPPGFARADYLGANHQGAFVRVSRDDADLLPSLFDAIEAAPPRGIFRVDVDVMRRERVLPLHYLRLYYHRDRELEAQRRCGPRGLELERIANALHAHFAVVTDGKLPDALFSREMPWIEDAVVPACVALLGGRSCELYASRPNRGRIAGLADDAVIESLTAVEADALRPVPFSAPLESAPGTAAMVALTRAVVEFEAAALAAADEPTEERVFDALARHPWRVPEEAARGMARTLIDRGTRPERSRSWARSSTG